MLLSKDTRVVIDTLLSYDEDLPNRYYSVRELEEKIENGIRVIDILEDMNKQDLLQWGDKQHTGFRLMERARAYKEIQRLEGKERWKERATGFISGMLLTVIAWMLSSVV